jgi:hypothetical protein
MVKIHRKKPAKKPIQEEAGIVIPDFTIPTTEK